MKNGIIISETSCQLLKACENISSLANSLENLEKTIRHDYEQRNEAERASRMYAELLMDELEHAQILTLALTRLIAPNDEHRSENADSDGGVFAAGELNHVKKNEIETGEAQ